jgi:hypothetical protein
MKLSVANDGLRELHSSDPNIHRRMQLLYHKERTFELVVFTQDVFGDRKNEL